MTSHNVQITDLGLLQSIKLSLPLVELSIFEQFSCLHLVSFDQFLGFDQSANSNVDTKTLTKVGMFQAWIKSNIKLGFFELLPLPGKMCTVDIVHVPFEELSVRTKFQKEACSHAFDLASASALDVNLGWRAVKLIFTK